jgi:hypothetical protein
MTLIIKCSCKNSPYRLSLIAPSQEILVILVKQFAGQLLTTPARGNVISLLAALLVNTVGVEYAAPQY